MYLESPDLKYKSSAITRPVPSILYPHQLTINNSSTNFNPIFSNLFQVAHQTTAKMVSTKVAIVSLASAVGLFQMCPAPPAVIAAVAGGVAAGAVGGGATLCAKWCPDPRNKRSVDYSMLTARDLPPGVSQESLDQCTQQINEQKDKGISVEITSNSEDSKCIPQEMPFQDISLIQLIAIDVANVPPACMNLATVLTGNPAQAGGPVPIPMGSDKLQYTGIKGEDRQNLAKALGA